MKTGVFLLFTTSPAARGAAKKEGGSPRLSRPSQLLLEVFGLHLDKFRFPAERGKKQTKGKKAVLTRRNPNIDRQISLPASGFAFRHGFGTNKYLLYVFKQVSIVTNII